MPIPHSVQQALKVQDLSLGYDRVLINKLHFTLNVGERLIIYGANGTGKSTFLQSLLKKNYQASGMVQWSLPQSDILFLQQQASFHSQTPDDVESYLLHILFYKNIEAKKM